MARTTIRATDESERTWPVPPQCGQGFMVDSRTLARMRWRLISIRPKCEIRPSWMRARSFFRWSLRRFSTARLLRFSSMSMKSMTIRPARSRRRKLAGDFLGRFQIGVERRLLDRMLAWSSGRS